MRHALCSMPFARNAHPATRNAQPVTRLFVPRNKAVAQGMDKIRIGPVIENAVIRTLELVDTPEEYVKNAAEILFVAVIRLLIAQILVQCQGVDVVLQDVEMGIHGLVQGRLIIVLRRRSQIIRFPIEQVKASLVAKHHIDISFHEPDGRAKVRFSRRAGNCSKI